MYGSSRFQVRSTCGLHGVAQVRTSWTLHDLPGLSFAPAVTFYFLDAQRGWLLDGTTLWTRICSQMLWDSVCLFWEELPYDLIDDSAMFDCAG